MPSDPIPPTIEAFLREPNPSVVGTVRRDGRPHSTATWYDWQDGRVLLNMDASRARLGWMTPGSPVSLTILDRDDWYVHVTLEGRVAGLRDDPDLVDIDRLSTRYRGQPYHTRDRLRVSAWITVDAWHGWGQPRAS
jgi:PPOX class probable F420-dependent enzyme